MNMAALSSSSSSTSKEYDVFISFRGEDTRCNFTSHLVSAFSRNAIRVYVDYEIKKGDEISSSLIKAIHDSYGSLVVFSKNYAFSKWCLNELLQILKCRKEGHFVIPVFYNVDPSCVCKQTESYGEAFAKHEHDSRNKEKLQLWKAALIEAANIAGWDSQSQTNRDESELIQNIVNDILQKMNHIYKSRESSLVGTEKYYEDVELLLQRTMVVGIWGIGGVGKTTIAKVVFDKVFSQYDSCYFFENVREETQRNGLNYIRDKLLAELLKDQNSPSSTPKDLAFKFVMRRLSNKKVLIVLDDVNSSKQLEYLQQEFNCLRTDSKVIITTRDKQVLNGFRVCYEIYKVEGLNSEESLHLFRLNAFNENNLEIGYEEITEKIVHYAKGNPLALKVLGSFLLSKSKEEWESALLKLNKIPNDDIQKVLRLSYDELDHVDQQIFLDVACFLKGEHVESVISLLDSFGFYGRIGMRTLQDKALVTILPHKIVDMHDLLQEMGRDIVRRESIKYPEKRSRLCDSNEAYDVLINNKGVDTIEGIMLNLSQIKDLSLKVDSFRKMTNLRFVKIYSSYYGSCKVDLPGSIELPFKKLSYLRWDEYPLPSLPTNFCAEKLVMLHLPQSNITKLWDGLQDIVNLKKIDLAECTKLMKLPNFSKASKLESVDLSSCSNLCHIHPSLLHLDSLVYLDVSKCKKLRSLESDRHLKSLEYVHIKDCSSLEKFSLSSEKLVELDFAGTALETLTSSLGRCRNLEGLFLFKCHKLFQLPRNISMLSSLKKLYLHGSSVESLPESIQHFSCLECLSVSNCQTLRSLPELPPSIKKLWATDCFILETLIPPSALEYCDLKNCVKLDEQSLSCITAYAHYRIKRVEITRICLPGDGVLGWFTYRTMQNMISIELPQRSNLLGFVFGLYFCHHYLRNCLVVLRMRCKCYLGYNDTKKFLIGECNAIYDCGSDEVNSDDVHMWIYKCDSTLDSFNAISETGGNCLVSFQFYAFDLFNRLELDHMIKGCGVWPIYASELDLELELSDNSKRDRGELESFDHQGIEVGALLQTKQDEQIPQKLLSEFTFQPLSSESKMLNDNNEAFDFFNESKLGDKCKRLRCESEVDEQLQLSLTKKSEDSTLQPVPMELELELNTKSYSYLEIEGMQVGRSSHEKRDRHESLHIDKRIQGIEDADDENQTSMNYFKESI